MGKIDDDQGIPVNAFHASGNLSCLRYRLNKTFGRTSHGLQCGHGRRHVGQVELADEGKFDIVRVAVERHVQPPRVVCPFTSADAEVCRLSFDRKRADCATPSCGICV